MSMDKTLETLTGKVTVPWNGRDVEVKRLTLRTMKPIIDFVRDIYSELETDDMGIPSIMRESQVEGSLPPTFVEVILKLISKYYDESLSVVVLLTDLEEDDLLDMEADKALEVILKVVEVNRDFFTQRILPQLPAILKKTEQQTSEDESSDSADKKPVDKKAGKTTATH